jgi:hypothetical protein
MNDQAERIVLVDLRIPFFRLVMFFVKVALAAIPAAIILAVIGFVVSAIFYALAGGSSYLFMQRWNM